MGQAVVRVFDWVGEDAFTSEQGCLVNFESASYLDNGCAVVLDFSGVKRFTVRFLSFAVGQQYRDYEHRFLDENLSAINMDNLLAQHYSDVVENAKEQYSKGEEEDGVPVCVESAK